MTSLSDPIMNDTPTPNAAVAPTFGSYVRKLRLGAGLGVNEFAKRMGLSAAYYVRVEFGVKSPFTADRWEPLLALGASSEALRALAAAYWSERAGRMQGRPTRVDREAVPPGHPRSTTWEELPYEDDDWCRYAVAQHPDGLSIEHISTLTGWSPERVEEIEQSALAKLRRRPGAREALETMMLLRQHRDGMLQLALDGG